MEKGQTHSYSPLRKKKSEKTIPTKARPIKMNKELLEFCKKQIHALLEKGLIRSSKSPWSCAEKERGVPRLVINYKPLNKVLQWIRYPIPNKRDLLNRLYDAKVFLKFDMKSEFDVQNCFCSTIWALRVECYVIQS